MKRHLVACLPWLISAALRADDGGLDAALDDLLSAPVQVASQKPTTVLDSPAVITVITAEDIAAVGARDLMDVLRLVPGFSFGVDVQGVTSLLVRGLWAHEGKALLLVDGQEYNEILYSSLPLSRRIPVSRIERVEVIRGPGSALYGGFAELAVIKVITKIPEGISADAAVGRWKRAESRRDLTLAVGASDENARFHMTLFGGTGRRSDRDYTDNAGTVYNMKDQSALDPFMANLGLSIKGWEARVISDRLRTTYRDHFDAALPEAVTQNFNYTFAELKRSFSPAPGWTVKPVLKWKSQEPWYVPSNPTYEWHRTAERMVGRLAVTRDLDGGHSLTAGGELTEDRARAWDPADLFYDGNDRFYSHNAAGFFEAVGRAGRTAATVGGRYEKNSRFGSVFVPRAAVTGGAGPLSLKALYSRAFRAPGVMNLNLNPLVRPEKTTAMEFEAGWRFSSRQRMTVNVFDVRIKDPIVYQLLPGNVESYDNFERTGSRGVEVTHDWRGPRGFLSQASYAFSRAFANKTSAYDVPGHPQRLLAAPAQKASWRVGLPVPGRVAVSPALEWVGPRYGYDYDAGAGAMGLRRFSSDLFVDVTLRRPDLFVKGFSAAVTGHDLLDRGTTFIQPYNGDHPPLPGGGREWSVRLSYDASF